MKRYLFSLYGAASILIFTSCKSLNKTQAETGRNDAGITNILADFKTNNTMAGALMDGMLTGDAGISLGKRMDDEAGQIQKAIPGAEVKRIGQGINITFESGFLFDKGSAEIGSAAKENLEKLAVFFTNNPNTKILIEGHTSKDTTQNVSDEANLKLSEQRAVAVSHFLETKGVSNSRITEKWYGGSQPKYANDTEANREKNRRVEIGLIADETYKKMLQEGKNK